MKKSILFVADKPDWAYHNIIKTWYKDLSENFDCYITFANDFFVRKDKFTHSQKIKNRLSRLINSNDGFIIDRSLRFSFPQYKNPPVFKVSDLKKAEKTHFDIIIEMAYFFQYTSAIPFTADKKMVGIYTDSFPHEGPSYDVKTNTKVSELNRKDFFLKYLSQYDGIIVGNLNLFDDYRPYTNNIVFANGIYRQNEFEENNRVGENENLVIGWTGNPNRPMKGFKEIIIPALEKVKATGRKIELKTQFSGTYDSILSFYKDVDLVAIASDADTGPSLFSEACLSKVPSVSTQIGFPKMIIKDQKNGVFINRDVSELAAAIIDFYDNREKLKSFSDRIKSDYLDQLDNAISITNLTEFLRD